MADRAELASLRLVAQHIAGPGLATPRDVVGWLTAVQGQDLPGALASVALRTTGPIGIGPIGIGRERVVAALDAGEIVRGWPMRGTLHLTLAEDLPWLTALLAPRVLTGVARRHAQLGLDPAILGRARAVAEATLGGGGRCSRAELLAAWQRHGLDTGGRRGYHLIGYLAQTGALCLGPMREGEQLLVLSEEWIHSPRRPEREEALAELALRYFRGHGPATRADLIRWAGLTAADAGAGLARARPGLDRLEVDGVEYLMDPQTPERLRAARRGARRVGGVFLLPGFDELVLGYADRAATVPPAYADRICPGGNGVFQPTVVSAGRAVGTWRFAGRGGKRQLVTSPFQEFGKRVADALPRLAAAYPA